MSEYTVDLNGTRYALNEEFRDALKRRAELEYEKNKTFSAWWSVAHESDYTEEAWEDNIHEEGDPILTIETDGVMVPWDKLDQLEAAMPQGHPMHDEPDDEPDEVDEGNSMKTIDPDEKRDTNRDIFGRSHFSLTPHRFEELPSPGGDDPDKVPLKPEKVDGNALVLWVPRHPDVTYTWGAGETMVPMCSWVEWNVQKRADQPQPSRDKDDSHDRFESLCKIHGCESVGEYTPSNNIPEGTSGSVERKGKDAFDEGRFGGGHWNV